jgi:hypothetical protein
MSLSDFVVETESGEQVRVHEISLNNPGYGFTRDFVNRRIGFITEVTGHELLRFDESGYQRLHFLSSGNPARIQYLLMQTLPPEELLQEAARTGEPIVLDADKFSSVDNSEEGFVHWQDFGRYMTTIEVVPWWER